MSFAVSCSYLQLAARESINKPCKNRWSRLVETNHLLGDSDLFMTVKKPRRARWRALGGRRDYWEHCASILAILKSYKKKNKKLVKKKLFIYANLVMLSLEFC